MITVKEYAEKNNVNIQTVYTRMRTHAADLEGHIFEFKSANGRTCRYLDDKAVEIITKKKMQRKKRSQETKLRQENQELQLKIKKLQDELAMERSSANTLYAEKTKLLKMLQKDQPPKGFVVFPENYEILKSQAERKGVAESEIVNDLIVYFLDMPSAMRKSLKTIFEQLLEIEKNTVAESDLFWAREKGNHIKTYQKLIDIISK